LYEKVVSEYLEKTHKLLAKPKYKFSEATRQEVPADSGVYAIHENKLDTIIYVGRTKNLRRRLLGDHKRGNIEGSQFRKAIKRYFSLETEDEISNHISKNCTFQFLVIEENEDMIRLEHFATAILAPILNVKLKQ